MINRVALLFSLAFLFLASAGCVVGQMERIRVSTLSPEEMDKVKAVRMVENDRSDKTSYKPIKKVTGLSCEKYWIQRVPTTTKVRVEGKASRIEAEEQLKIRTVRAGGNAIINIVCVYVTDDPSRNRGCIKHIACSGDAIYIK